jgi:mannose-6-phosphate isomerase-like protein (cupin superfamily)
VRRAFPDDLREEFNMETKKLQATVFKYAKPALSKAKTVVRLCKSDLMYANVQVITEGGENNLHAHPAQDGFWMVIKGRARFYADDDVVIGDFGPFEGVHIPRGFNYWFESSSPDTLELLQVEAVDLKAEKNERVNVRPLAKATIEAQKI